MFNVFLLFVIWLLEKQNVNMILLQKTDTAIHQQNGMVCIQL